MAAASATARCVALRDNELAESKIQPSKTGLDDACSKDMFTNSKWRCDTLCMQRDPTEAFTPLSSLVQARSPNPPDFISHDLDKQFLKIPIFYSNLVLDTPPSYLDSTDDAPPAYAEVNLHQILGAVDSIGPTPCKSVAPGFHLKSELGPPFYSDLIGPMTTPSIDFSDTSNLRQAKGNKKAKNQKQANKNSWEGSGDEASKDVGGGEENAGGGDGGGSGAGGAGGEGGGDGGGDDWNDWNAPSNKKKKKGKKGKGGADDEEEKRKKEEEEEEQKGKEKEQGKDEADAGNAGSLAWANEGEGNQDDEWGSFTTKKSKKGKKDKNPDPTTTNPISAKDLSLDTFNDIDLGNGPQLDLDFGADTGTKGAGGSFSFGSWGNNWGNSTSKWDFSTADSGNTNITDKSKDAKDKSPDGGDGGIWSFGSSKKNNKKNSTTAGFDFGLGALDENNEEDTSKNADGWGAFAPAGGKSKKNKKKNAIDEVPTDTDIAGIGTALEEPSAAVEDIWATWGTTADKKDKKKGKKGDQEEMASDPPPQPVAPPPEDEWSSFGTKKDKKKGKKGDQDETSSVPPPPPVAPLLEDEWSSFGTKKDKKKGKKGDQDEVATIPPPPPVAPPPEDEWSSFGTKKDKKKGKKGDQDETSSVPPPPPVAPLPEDDWGGFGTKKDKKKGKKGVGDASIEETSAAVATEVEPEADPGWASFGTKKKGKKGQVEEQPPKIDTVDEPKKEHDAAFDLGWEGFETGKKGKKKKGKADAWEETGPDPILEKEPEPEPEADLGFTIGGKKTKKGKKGAFEEPLKKEASINAVPDFESTLDDGWGAFGTSKDKKKSKKGAFEDFATNGDADVIQSPDLEPANDNGWGATMTKDKKTSKKGLIFEIKDDPIVAVEPVTTAGISVMDNDWMNWDPTDKKSKKGKKGTTAEETVPPPPPPPPAEPEPSILDSWATTTATKIKKGKKGKIAEPEPVLVVSDPPENKVDSFEEEFGSGWGLSAKDRKKKEKEREKERKENEEREKEKAEQEEKEKVEAEKEKTEKDKVNDKGKLGKKGKAAAASEASKAKDLMADSVPDTVPPVVEEEDSWGMWGSSAKKDKKKVGKNAVHEIPPPVPTPPAQGLTPEPDLIPGLEDEVDNGWASFAPTKAKGKKDTKSTSKSAAAKKTSKDKAEENFADPPKDEAIKTDPPKEESAAKAAKSFWGSVGTTSTKSKIGKDKDAAKEKDLVGLDDLLDDEILGTIEPAVPTSKKGGKSKADNKLSKVGSKESDKSKKSDDALLNDLLELGDEALAEVLEEPESKKTDSWGFWGSTKKTAGQKADELPKEITKPNTANQKSSLKNNLKKEKEPEAATTVEPADEAAPSQSSKAFKSTMSASKATAKSSVLQRVKDLEKEKEKESGKTKARPAEATPEPQPAAPEIDPLPKPDPTPSKKSATTKSKAAAKKKDLSPPAAEVKDINTVPGSFPGEGLDDDLLDLLDSPPVEKTPAKKAAKTKKEVIKEPKKEPKTETVMDMMDDFDFDAPAPPAPPTPPAEPVAEKPAKKERARVVKNEGASSWGFWGATPKKEIKKDLPPKDDADVSSKPKDKKAAPGLSRSKSTKTAKEKDKEVEKSSKSSGSDEKEKKAETRPSKSRGSSFGGFFGGPPPVRAKTVRRNSTAASKTTSSHRQSMDVDAIGLPSPPAEDTPEMSSKAAKLMGTAKTNKKVSTNGKQKARVVPDPYAIDDDDMVMVGGLDDPILNDPVPQEPAAKTKKEKVSKSKSKIEAKPSPDPAADDVVMIEAGSPLDELDGAAREPLAFDERPRPQRSNTSARKPKTGGIGGLFGFGKTRRASESFDRPRSKGVLTDDEGLSRRKRAVTGGDDSVKRLRREDRKVRRSDREDRAAEGFVYDAPTDRGLVTEAEDMQARRERKAKRAAAKDADLRDAEDRRVRRREAEQRASEDARKLKAKEARDRRARKEEEAEAIRLEEKRARRAARAEMNAKLEPASRPAKADRRRSYMDQPAAAGANDDAERRARREARRAARTPGEKSSRQKTTAAVDDYFDARNGAPAGGQDPYMHGANDHTSSWVKSQISDPAPPPPVEGTVIEPTPVLGGATDDNALNDDDAARRAKRQSRRQSRYVDEDQEARRRRKEREREIRSSEGSRDDDAGRPYASRRKSDYVGGMKTFDARPALAAGGKRGSWLKRVSGF